MHQPAPSRRTPGRVPQPLAGRGSGVQARSPARRRPTGLGHIARKASRNARMPLDAAQPGHEAGRVAARHRMAKRFRRKGRDGRLSVNWRARIGTEAYLDGIHMPRSGEPAERRPPRDTVRRRRMAPSQPRHPARRTCGRPSPRPGPVPTHRADIGSAQHISSKRSHHREPSEAEKCDFQPTRRARLRAGRRILGGWDFMALCKHGVFGHFHYGMQTLFTLHVSPCIRRTVPVFRPRFRAAARATSACRVSGRVRGWRRRRCSRARSAAALFPADRLPARAGPVTERSGRRFGSPATKPIRNRFRTRGRLQGGIAEDADCGKDGPYRPWTAGAEKYMSYHALDKPRERGSAHGFRGNPIFFPELQIEA